jgi:hypothetical protein
MPAIVEPVLQACRDIYDLEAVMARYHAYVRLMTEARGELLPLGAFSPMGKRQQGFLDALLAHDAEAHAQAVADAALAELRASTTYRVALVVVDEPRNGWTQRHLTDAEWRFPASNSMPKQNTPRIPGAVWASVQLWTTEFAGRDRPRGGEHLREYVAVETRAALARAEYQQRHGPPGTLAEMLAQEGVVLRFSGEHIVLSGEDLEYTQAVLKPYMENKEYPINFAAFYGDEAAKAVGFAPLGVSERAGFALALANAGQYMN